MNDVNVDEYRSPDTAGVKSKMLYASCKASACSHFSGVEVVVHATDMSELELEYVIDKFRK